MLVANIPDVVEITSGTYKGKYQYSDRYSTRTLLGWYKTGGDPTRDPHFSVDNKKEFTHFHISFDVGGRNIHFYYHFTGEKGLVETTGNTGRNDGFSSRQIEAAEKVLDWKHKQLCHDLAQQFFSAVIASEMERQREDSLAEMQSHLKRLHRAALGLPGK